MKRVIVLFGLLFGFFALAGGWFWKSTAVTPVEPWSPSNPEGTAVLWVDPSHNASLTLDGGSVASIASRVGVWTYSEATNKPTLGSLNGVQVLQGDGTQYLTKDQDTLIVTAAQKFLFGIVYEHTTINSDYDGFWGDGTSSDQVIKFGRSNQFGYTQIFFGTADDRIARFNADALVPAANGDVQAVVIEYNGVENIAANYEVTVNGSVKPSGGSGGFGFTATKGGIFQYQGVPYIPTGKVGDIVVINGHTSTDKSNLIEMFRSKYSLY